MAVESFAGKESGHLPVLQRRRWALVGSPNSGKSTLFNSLTGLRVKVANYPGVTVDRVEGILTLEDGTRIELVDLPGIDSDRPLSLDEKVTMEVLGGVLPQCPPVDGILFVASSTSLARTLPLLGAFLSSGIPVVVAVTMVDEMEGRGGQVRVAGLEKSLGVPVLGVVGTRGIGVGELRKKLAAPLALPNPEIAVPDGREERFEWADAILKASVSAPSRGTPLTDRIDSILLHPVLGILVFAAVMVLFFQAIFAWAAPLQDGLEGLVASLGALCTSVLPAGYLQQILVDGILAGVGSVVVFIPQIAILFALLGLLEQLGYMSRAVFLVDRVLGWVGLDGRSFVAFLSSYACAVPGIMATRSIPDPRSRLTTILVAPFFTCSARLPVYTILIAAFVPSVPILWVFNLKGFVMLGLYLLGSVTAMLAAFFLRRGPLKGQALPFYVELPPYRLPTARALARVVWVPVSRFLRRAGTIILVAALVLWILLSFPAADPPASVTQQGEQAIRSFQMEHSLAGRLGHFLEPAFAPIGFDWRVTIGLVASLAAREVVVSSLAQIYAVEGAEDDPSDLSDALRLQLRAPGAPPDDRHRLASALSLLIFFVFALQCVSTLAVIRRETGSWRWPTLAFTGMFVIAYAASFITYRLTLWLA